MRDQGKIIRKFKIVCFIIFISSSNLYADDRSVINAFEEISRTSIEYEKYNFTDYERVKTAFLELQKKYLNNDVSFMELMEFACTKPEIEDRVKVNHVLYFLVTSIDLVITNESQSTAEKLLNISNLIKKSKCDRFTFLVLGYFYDILKPLLVYRDIESTDLSDKEIRGLKKGAGLIINAAKKIYEEQKGWPVDEFGEDRISITRKIETLIPTIDVWVYPSIEKVIKYLESEKARARRVAFNYGISHLFVPEIWEIVLREVREKKENELYFLNRIIRLQNWKMFSDGQIQTLLIEFKKRADKGNELDIDQYEIAIKKADEIK